MKAALADLVDMIGGGTPSKEVDAYWGGDIPWASVKDFKSHELKQTEDCITKLGLDNSASHLIPAGNIIIPTRMALGKVATNLVDMAINQDLRALIVRNEKVINKRYLFRFLESKAKYLEGEGKGATVKGITLDVLRGLEVPLPPLPEQRRIAAILDQADALRAKRREALAELDKLAQSIFVEMFGDPVANPKQWPSQPLSEVVDGKYGVKAGPFGSSLKKEEYTSSGYRIYGQEQVIAGRFDIGDYYISKKKFEQLQSCAVATGDLLVSLVGSFGKILIVPDGIEPGIINPRLLKITPNTKLTEPQFLAALLQHPTVQSHFERVAHGGTMGILNAGLIKQLNTILPPIELQRTFMMRLKSLETLREQQEIACFQQEKLFSSVQHRAFRGEL